MKLVGLQNFSVSENAKFQEVEKIGDMRSFAFRYTDGRLESATTLWFVGDCHDTRTAGPPLASSTITTIMVSDAFANRPIKKLCLFDVDGTLTPARQVCEIMFCKYLN